MWMLIHQLELPSCFWAILKYGLHYCEPIIQTMKDDILKCSWYQYSYHLTVCRTQSNNIECKIENIKVTGYREGAWFKNNFAQVFSPCNCYAGVTTTSNAVSFRSLWSKSALQELVHVQSYHTRAQRYTCSRYTVQIFAASFLKLCASVRPVFLVYSPHKYCQGTDESFFE